VNVSMMDLHEAARAVAGSIHGDAVRFSGVSTDSRNIARGDLFVALAGERFDGHDFLAAVRDAGAAAALVNSDRLPALAALGLPLLAVDDTRRALGTLAGHWRRKFTLPLVGVTGSNGKTTTKEMIAAILRADAVALGLDPEKAVLATRGNLNNDIGLPLTLFRLSAATRAAVIEMGMNHPGEIAYLAGLAQPTVAVVTNAQRAHLQGMGSLDEVAGEKGSLFASMPADGVAVINADDAYCATWQRQAGHRRQLTFSIDGPGDIAGHCVLRGLESEIHLSTPAGHLDFVLPVPGRHNARNAVAAAAVAFAAGIGLAAIRAGLAGFAGVTGRLQRRAGQGGALLIDDTYNANPDSVRAAIDVLASANGPKFLVLGDMGEIGAALQPYHAEVGAYACAAGVDQLFALGASSVHAVAAFGAGATHFATPEALVAALQPLLAPGVTVLVKGSRFMRMERIANALAVAADGSGKEQGEH